MYKKIILLLSTFACINILSFDQKILELILKQKPDLKEEHIFAIAPGLRRVFYPARKTQSRHLNRLVGKYQDETTPNPKTIEQLSRALLLTNSDCVHTEVAVSIVAEHADLIKDPFTRKNIEIYLKNLNE